jgi:hypothetical protein
VDFGSGAFELSLMRMEALQLESSVFGDIAKTCAESAIRRDPVESPALGSTCSKNSRFMSR